MVLSSEDEDCHTGRNQLHCQKDDADMVCTLPCCILMFMMTDCINNPSYCSEALSFACVQFLLIESQNILGKLHTIQIYTCRNWKECS